MLFSFNNGLRIKINFENVKVLTRHTTNPLEDGKDVFCESFQAEVPKETWSNPDRCSASLLPPHVLRRDGEVRLGVLLVAQGPVVVEELIVVRLVPKLPGRQGGILVQGEVV